METIKILLEKAEGIIIEEATRASARKNKQIREHPSAESSYFYRLIGEGIEMNKLLIIFFLISGGILLARDADKQSLEKDDKDFEKMSFKIQSGKESYYPLETVFLTFTIANESDKELTVYRPAFQAESRLKVIGPEKTKIYDIPPAAERTPSRLPMKFSPGDLYQEIVTVEVMRDEILPSPGSYEIQMILLSPDRTSSLTSNKITITRAETQGVDSEAYHELKKYSQYIGPFSGFFVEKGGLEKLENFVNLYGSSVYGELAIYNLGLLYQSNQEYDKAIAQFERIKSGGNSEINKSASLFLEKIKKDKEAADREKLPKKMTTPPQ